MKYLKDTGIPKPNSSKLKICMLLPFPPYSFSNMRIVPQIGICSYLSNFGHSISWVIWTETNSPLQTFSFNNVHMYCMKYIRYFVGNSDLVKGFNQVLNIFKRMYFISQIGKKSNYNLLFVRDSVLDGLIAIYLNRKYGTPFVFELVNPINQDWEGYKLAKKKPLFMFYLIAKFIKLIKIYIMKKADLVLTTTKWFEGELIKKGIRRTKLMPYPNGVDIECFTDKNGNNIIEKYHLNNLKVIIYIGTMDKVRCLDVLIEAFAKVKKQKKNVKLLLVGEGNDKKNLECLSNKLEIKNDVIFIGQIPQLEVPYYIDAADIGVSPVPPHSFYKVSSPIKMLEYMAMAKPVVANEEIFDHKEIIEESGGGIFVPFTSEAFADAIIELLDNAEKATKMGQKGREWIVKNRTYGILARLLEDKYFEILKKMEIKERIKHPK